MFTKPVDFTKSVTPGIKSDRHSIKTIATADDSKRKMNNASPSGSSVSRTEALSNSNSLTPPSLPTGLQTQIQNIPSNNNDNNNTPDPEEYVECTMCFDRPKYKNLNTHILKSHSYYKRPRLVHTTNSVTAPLPGSLPKPISEPPPFTFRYPEETVQCPKCSNRPKFKNLSKHLARHARMNYCEPGSEEDLKNKREREKLEKDQKDLEAFKARSAEAAARAELKFAQLAPPS